MFPHAPAPDTPSRRWAATLRHGLDVLVAFATLRDVGQPSTAYDAVSAGPAGAPRRVGAARVAQSVGGPRAVPAHPHRHPLRPPPRARRPGVLPAPPQPCLTPLAARRRRGPKAPAGRV